ncbi:ANTAR domain-containing response regulator [Undibacterium pigrum]|uniref:Response regulator receiver and ANTAR domain protein n=1 Tax=Undibacterium pigrum TaxID=401470 RepID=A0A318IR27_9BURK|nr:response regulator [Undibacterium pigrum]PXX37949.1 response regulator receiver and ANTAR domain protein [Undibacterium pigrum]
MVASVNTKSRILLVDDDQVTLTLLSKILEKADYEVTQAHSGEDALNVILMQEPDIALLDINMPGMSGLDLASRLRTDTSVPFMFLSATSDAEIVRRAVEYGAVGYMVKPVDVLNIVPTVEASLARANEIKKLKKSEINLTSALASGRETSMAVGLLMTKFQSSRQVAFDVLRNHARSNRRPIHEVANELLRAEETINQFRVLFNGK